MRAKRRQGFSRLRKGLLGGGASAKVATVGVQDEGRAPRYGASRNEKKKLDMPIAAYPGVYAQDESGKWRVTEAKRGVPQIDGTVRTTAKGMRPANVAPAAEK